MQCKHRVSLCKGGELLVAEMRTFSSKQRINTSRQSNPVQCRLEKSHPERLLEMMRPRNQNLFVEKVDWNMKCERRDNLWVIRNCPSAGRQKLLVIFFFCARVRWWKPIENWMEATKIARYLRSVFGHTHPSTSFQFGQKFGRGSVGWKLWSSVDNCCVMPWQRPPRPLLEPHM